MELTLEAVFWKLGKVSKLVRVTGYLIINKIIKKESLHYMHGKIRFQGSMTVFIESEIARDSIPSSIYYSTKD